MIYKKSKYNIFVDYVDSQIVVFNTLSGAIGLWDNLTKKRYDSNTLTDEEIGLLLKKGILYISDDENEELKRINNCRINGITDSNNKYYRIWSTSSCNANCYYCFEHGISHEMMNKITISQTTRFIKNSLKWGDKLTIEWFGGEPLINTRCIDDISKDLILFCKKNGIKYSSHIITNGSMIDSSIANRFFDSWNISSAQITLDGDAEYYNNVKAYNDKKYNFNCVIKGIRLLLEHDIRVSIRMNYCMTNFENLSILIDHLYGEFGTHKGISYYIYPLWSSLNENDINPYKSKSKADKKIIKLFDKLVDYGMSSERKLARLNFKKNQCKACNRNSYVIFPNGDLGKCCEAFGCVLGNVWDGICYEEKYKYWVSTGIDDECINCVYLPLCQGGCRASGLVNMPKCYIYKEIINEILRWYVQRMQNNRLKP